MPRNVSCRLDDELAAQLEVFKAANNLSQSQAIRELLRQILTDADPITRGWREGFAAAYAETREAIAMAAADLRR